MSADGRSTYKSLTEHGFDLRLLMLQNNALITNPHIFSDPQESTVPVMEVSVGGGRASSWVSAL